MALINALREVEGNHPSFQGGRPKGLDTRCEALLVPLWRMACNADADMAISTAKKQVLSYSFEAENNSFTNLLDQSVINLIKAMVTALEKAISVADLILSHQFLLVDKTEFYDSTTVPARGEDGGKYVLNLERISRRGEIIDRQSIKEG